VFRRLLSQFKQSSRLQFRKLIKQTNNFTAKLKGADYPVNQRPRKTLGFETPADRLRAALH
jgi:IS30 family transposase